MPEIAQRLREPAAFALLAYAALSTLLYSIDILFGPGQDGTCGTTLCGAGFSNRAAGELETLTSPLVAAALVGAVVLAHVQSHIKMAKNVALAALITTGVALLVGVISLLAGFGSDYGGWAKTETFFIGAAELAVLGIAGWFILGYYQMHAPAAPTQAFAPQNPPVQFQQPGQWQQPAQTQAAPAPAQGQWNPPAPPQQQQQQAPQAWGPPAQQPPPQAPQPQGNPWGPPPSAAPQQPQPPQQQGFGGGAESMMTQAIPTIPRPPQPSQPPQPPQPPVPPQQPAPETQQFPPVGNWTTD
jgi:hypothetical protein